MIYERWELWVIVAVMAFGLWFLLSRRSKTVEIIDDDDDLGGPAGAVIVRKTPLEEAKIELERAKEDAGPDKVDLGWARVHLHNADLHLQSALGEARPLEAKDALTTLLIEHSNLEHMVNKMRRVALDARNEYLRRQIPPT